MKTLVVHPEDSPRRGPWTALKWDLLVDLGRSSEQQICAWKKELGCEVLALDSVRDGDNDARAVREILFAGRGRLLDAAGLDWWELNGIEFHEELEQVLLLRRLATHLAGVSETHATRPCWQVEALAAIVGRDLRHFDTPSRNRLARLQNAAQRLSLAQMVEVAFDKHDPEYKWRRKVSRTRAKTTQAQVLVPSAYVNVSRMAADYARQFPEQQFLLAATRRSALDLDLPPNMTEVALAAYAQTAPNPHEYEALLQTWHGLHAELESFPEFRLLASLGRLHRFAPLLRSGLAARDAWQTLLAKEPIAAVLCGDDSNPPTRIPVVLAKQKGLPTVDFHHGAFDGRFLLKTLPADVYVAKSEMEHDYLVRVCGLQPERIVIGAPRSAQSTGPHDTKPARHIAFFSEPYEIGGTRAEEVYRELLPPLAALAARLGLTLTLKLHPFESLRERRRLVRQVLPRAGREVSVVAGVPLAELLQDAYCGVTVESSTVLDCALHGVPGFLCGWRSLSSFGYTQQYARYGVGQLLHSAAEIDQIPDLIAGPTASSTRQQGMWQQASSHELRALLSGKPMTMNRNP